MESFQAPKPPCGVVEITNKDLVRFLLFFAGLWFKTNQYWKAGKALLAAICLRLTAIWSNEQRVQLEQEGQILSIQNPLGLVVAARVVFASMATFEVHPFIENVLKELEKEVNELLSYYLLAVYQQEEPCG